ncbi:MAG: NAD(P)H-dependent oxidoreductase [Propionibacteriaceae bacterium]|nr:NAD(P)H-dependent oxidoreductase [Propionibacteriaceae bacterium]
MTVLAAAPRTQTPLAEARVVVLSAGHVEASSTARLGGLLGSAAHDALAAAGRPAEVTHLELRRVAVDVTTALLGAERTPALQDAVASVQHADALVVVTPTINASFSGLLKSFLDVLPPDALRSVPTTIAATGGTQRHTLVLDQAVRPMLGYQRAIVLPNCLYVTADEWEGPRPSAPLAERIGVAGAELAAFTPARAA